MKGREEDRRTRENGKGELCPTLSLVAPLNGFAMFYRSMLWRDAIHASEVRVYAVAVVTVSLWVCISLS